MCGNHLDLVLGPLRAKFWTPIYNEEWSKIKEKSVYEALLRHSIIPFEY